MPKTKTITIRVPIENYYEYLKNSATQKKPLSTYISDALSSIVDLKNDKPTKEEKYLQTQTPKISLVREDAPPIVKPKIVDNPVQEQKPKIADIPKIIVDNRKSNAEKPKPKPESNYVGDFDKSKWIYLEAPLDRVQTEYTDEAKENWRMTRERAFKMNHYSFSWTGNNRYGKQRVYDTFTGKQV